MLKIKDNIDLKELEKFKLYESEYGYVDKLNYFEKIFVDKDNRHINFCDEWYGDDFDLIDIIFDLISAGLVEKVVDSWKSG